MLRYEREAWAEGHARVAGVDEAGRGPLAGPVVAAAVWFEREWLESEAGQRKLAGLNDSKQLTAAQRERWLGVLEELAGEGTARIGLGEASAGEIDAMNILRATHLAMRRALEGLGGAVDWALVDGLPVKGLPVGHRAIVKGDGNSWSIAAASVAAKVTRDRWMTAAEERYPGYGFAKHKGYGTAEHLAALARLGPCEIHRRSFAPVGQMSLGLWG